jgi:predicted  nucleic acid-binding Zn-ribbon protein
MSIETITAMAEAHLLNVSKAVEDLTTQKNSIEKEIEKLNSYLAEGMKAINDLKSNTKDDGSVSNLSGLSKTYLGE